MALQNKAPFIIGITGGSGSGKTVFLNSFLNHFADDEICLVSQDDYCVPVGDLSAEENKLYNFDLPCAIDGEQFTRDVYKLLSGESVYKKEYTFNNPGAVPKLLTIKPSPIIIIEGLFILYFEKISKLPHIKIFIESDHEIALQRRIKRDMIERGYSEEDVLYKWHNHVIPAYNEFLLPHKTSCNKLIINNSDVKEGLIAAAEEISLELRVLLGMAN